MIDTVNRLMILADDYVDWSMAKGKEHPTYVETRQALEAELRKLLTPLSDEQIAKAWSVGEHNASAATKRRITRAIEEWHKITGGAE